MNTTLDIHLHDRRVGRLERDSAARLTFHYDPAYLERPRHGALSLSLPLREQPFADAECRPFFGNLLPEAGLRHRIAAQLGLSTENDFALLEALGGECAGAVSLLPAGQAASMEGEYRPLPVHQLAGIIHELPTRPLMTAGEAIRLSLAGAQDKLPLYRDEQGDFHWALGAAPSNIIIKPPIPGIEGSVENEFFCMRLAAAAGLNVAQAELTTIDGQRLFLVHRYDRHPGQTGQIERLHQEDFCQALGLPPEHKYEAEGGPGFSACFRLLNDHSAAPAPDRLRLLQWLLFNWLIGNMDAHGKNLALIHASSGSRLAPAYDLLSTDAIDHLNRRMAMAIGGEHRPDWIRLDHLEGLAQDAEINPRLVHRELQRLCDRLEQEAPALIRTLEDEHGPMPTLPRIQAIIDRRIRKARTGLLA